ncbi:MAG: hypothetical protein KBT04_00390 [Bacteroidales bacterium]|nr:hypothetical protein [Candidatus Colimorpha onthohippi]
MAKKVATKKAEEVNEEPSIIQPLDVDVAVEKRLVALYTLQLVDTEIDKIKIIRGELPQTIQDLEDDIEGLQKRIENYKAMLKEIELDIATRKNTIVLKNGEIETYKKQQENVRNNREYESLNKEIELAELEIQLCNQNIEKGNAKIKEAQKHIDDSNTALNTCKEEVEIKRNELDSIISETEKDEKRLLAMSASQEQYIEERYLTAYKRIRKAARNGLAVVTIDREACGGCFSKIPPQRQTEIKMHKKVIVCEHCGRILVDDDIKAKSEELISKK